MSSGPTGRYGWVDRRMALIIVLLDVRKIDGLGNAGVLKLASVIPEIGVVDEPPQIAFEMPDIDGIKPH